MIAHLGTLAKQKALDFINRTWRESKVPSQWSLSVNCQNNSYSEERKTCRGTKQLSANLVDLMFRENRREVCEQQTVPLVRTE